MTRSRTASSGARTPLYAEGDKVQYFSATYTQWMDTMITAVDPGRGALQLQCKPGYWLPQSELQKVRKMPN